MPIRKRFGQHFLTDAATLERIFAALMVKADDCVLEIGPGRGALTERLCAQAGRVAAIEIDRDLAAALGRRLPALQLVCGDALRADLRAIVAPPEQGDAGERWRVVGNLPYNIASPLLERLFALGGRVADIHVMLQAEVAARLAAQPGGKRYGRLSVMAQYHCRVVKLFDVDAASFAPKPKVASAFVRLTPREREPCDVEALRRVLRASFGQRRKILANALKSFAPNWRALGIDPGRRAESVTVAEYVAIANHCGGAGARQPSPDNGEPDAEHPR